jgi:putative ABC transport system ATP-binding protein
MTDLAREQGTTLVLVTHDARIAAYADRIVTVRDGLAAADLTRLAPAAEAAPS